jgi:diguanylate cyclase (GGDEF)-like protein
MITESAGNHGVHDDGALRVLLVEDNETFGAATRNALQMLDPDMDLQLAGTLETARTLVGSEQPFDLAVVDLNLPDAEESEAPRALREMAPQLAIVVLTGEQDPKLGARLIEAGIEDFMTKAEATPSAILLRIKLAEARRARRLSSERALRSDTLTGCLNRRGLLEVLRESRALADRFGIGSALCTLDLDGFKDVNDLYGHPAGDSILVESGARLSACIRATDGLGRPGGDEFWVVLPGVHCPRRAGETAERLRSCLEQPFELPESTVEVTASIGMAMLTSGRMSLERWIENSDAAMYRAKRAGGNQFKLYGSAGFSAGSAAAPG